MLMFRRCFLAALLCGAMVRPAAAVPSEWHEIKSDHFVVQYKKAPPRFVNSVVERAEEDYRKTSEVLGFTRYKGWIGTGRVKILVFDDANDYHRLGYGWSAGETIIRQRMIITYPSAHGFFDSVLPHELGHIIFRDFIGQDALVPLWLEEGVAMYQEEGRRWGADADVSRAIEEGKFISLPDLTRLDLTRDSDKDLVDMFYTEAASLVGFLINQGEMYRFARLCRSIKDGDDFNKALKQAYMKYAQIGNLETDWKEYLGHEKKKDRN